MSILTSQPATVRVSALQPATIYAGGIPRERGYIERVMAVKPNKLLAYWPLDEQTGTVAVDRTGYGHNGVYVACTLGQPGIGDGLGCPSFNGSSSLVNVYSVDLRDRFVGTQGTVLCWAQVGSASVWSDSTNRGAVNLADAANNNIIRISRHSDNNKFGGAWLAGGSARYLYSATYGGRLGWMCTVVRWTGAGAGAQLMVDGVQSVTGAKPGTWSGTLASTKMCIGGFDTGPTSIWSGQLAHCAIWSEYLTNTEVQHLAQIG
jgi:hypothetical protein